ncbi:MAG: O-antigen ligase family protein [Bryobacter sp.]|nr:O-antigen ligase family protein [Bryobacter sp.]
MSSVQLRLSAWAGPSLACSVALAFVSIAASQIFLGLAILLFFAGSPQPWRPALHWPPGMRWAAAFLLLTLLAALLSGEARSALPQIRKLFLWALLPLGATLFRSAFHRSLFAYPSLAAVTASALWSFWEYREKWLAAQAAGTDFYLAYVAARITGFMSHWMTFSAHMLLGFCLALALLLYTRRSWATRALLASLCLVFSAAILLAWTRSIWPGLALSSCLLVAYWRPRLLAALPVLALAAYLLAPASTQQRMASIFSPQGQVDSNQHRAVTFSTGTRMILAHPFLGLGPEGPGKHFREYLPPEWQSRPLPEGWYGHLHNVYLQYAAERGLPALFCFLVFVGLNVRLWLQRPSPLRRFALAAVAGLAVSALFEHNLGDSEVLTLFLALLGIGAAAEPPPLAPTEA